MLLLGAYFLSVVTARLVTAAFVVAVVRGVVTGLCAARNAAVGVVGMAIVSGMCYVGRAVMLVVSGLGAVVDRTVRSGRGGRGKCCGTTHRCN